MAPALTKADRESDCLPIILSESFYDSKAHEYRRNRGKPFMHRACERTENNDSATLYKYRTVGSDSSNLQINRVGSQRGKLWPSTKPTTASAGKIKSKYTMSKNTSNIKNMGLAKANASSGLHRKLKRFAKENQSSGPINGMDNALNFSDSTDTNPDRMLASAAQNLPLNVGIQNSDCDEPLVGDDSAPCKSNHERVSSESIFNSGSERVYKKSRSKCVFENNTKSLVAANATVVLTDFFVENRHFSKGSVTCKQPCSIKMTCVSDVSSIDCDTISDKSCAKKATVLLTDFFVENRNFPISPVNKLPCRQPVSNVSSMNSDANKASNSSIELSKTYIPPEEVSLRPSQCALLCDVPTCASYVSLDSDITKANKSAVELLKCYVPSKEVSIIPFASKKETNVVCALPCEKSFNIPRLCDFGVSYKGSDATIPPKSTVKLSKFHMFSKPLACTETDSVCALPCGQPQCVPMTCASSVLSIDSCVDNAIKSVVQLSKSKPLASENVSDVCVEKMLCKQPCDVPTICISNASSLDSNASTIKLSKSYIPSEERVSIKPLGSGQDSLSFFTNLTHLKLPILNSKHAGGPVEGLFSAFDSSTSSRNVTNVLQDCDKQVKCPVITDSRFGSQLLIPVRQEKNCCSLSSQEQKSLDLIVADKSTKVNSTLSTSTRLKAKYLSAHIKKQIESLVEHCQRDLNILCQRPAKQSAPKSPKHAQDTQAEILQNEAVKQLSTAELVKRILQGKSTVTSKQDIPGSMLDKSDEMPVNFDPKDYEGIRETSGVLLNSYKDAIRGSDPYVTESSEEEYDIESEEEESESGSEIEYENGEVLSKYLMHRMKLAARSTWLLFRINELKFRIKEYEDRWRDLETIEQNVCFEEHSISLNTSSSSDSGTGTSSSSESETGTSSSLKSGMNTSYNTDSGTSLQTVMKTFIVPLNGFLDHSDVPYKEEESSQPPDGKTITVFNNVRSSESDKETCARARLLNTASFRKRRLVVIPGLHKTSSKFSRLSTLNCVCSSQNKLAPCILCTGQCHSVQTVDPESMTIQDRVAILEPYFHSSLSTEEEIPLCLHMENVLKTDSKYHVVKQSVPHSVASTQASGQPKIRPESSGQPKIRSEACGQPKIRPEDSGLPKIRPKVSGLPKIRHRGLPKIRHGGLPKIRHGGLPKIIPKAFGQLNARLRMSDSKSRKKSLKFARSEFGRNLSAKYRNKQPTHQQKRRHLKKNNLVFGGRWIRVCKNALRARNQLRRHSIISSGSSVDSSVNSPMSVIDDDSNRDGKFNIDDVIIPCNLRTKVEEIQYKEIDIPDWRPADDDIPDETKTLQERIETEKEVCETLPTHNDILDRNQLSKEMIQDEKESLCDTVILRKHDLLEIEEQEKNKFSPIKLTRRMRRNRCDSRADSSGANTPVPTSLYNNQDNVFQAPNFNASTSAGPDSFESKIDSTINIVNDESLSDGSNKIERQNTKRKRDKTAEDNSSKRKRDESAEESFNTHAPVDFDEVSPFESIQFPLPDDYYQQLQIEAMHDKEVLDMPSNASSIPASPVSSPSPSSTSTIDDDNQVEDAHDPTWTVAQSCPEQLVLKLSKR